MNKQYQTHYSQQQQQLYKQNQLETQKQEIIFMMQQDLENMIGVIADTQASLEYFRHNPDHQYVGVAMNRLSLQTNLSNGIVADLQQQTQTQGELKNQLQSLKTEMAAKFTQAVDLSKLDPKIQEVAENYLKVNLGLNTVKQELKQKDVGIKAEFNQDVVQKVFSGMQQMDRTMEKIKDGERIQPVRLDKLQIHYQNRFLTAQDKLKQNYRDDYLKGKQWDQQQQKKQYENNRQDPRQNGQMDVEEQNGKKKDPSSRKSQENRQEYEKTNTSPQKKGQPNQPTIEEQIKTSSADQLTQILKNPELPEQIRNLIMEELQKRNQPKNMEEENNPQPQDRNGKQQSQAQQQYDQYNQQRGQQNNLSSPKDQFGRSVPNNGQYNQSDKQSSNIKTGKKVR